jgi:hypothetical protein
MRAFSLETVITWKAHPRGCYHVVRYKEIFSFTASNCKEYCGKEDRCVLVQHLLRYCYLSSWNDYQTRGCAFDSVMFTKGLLFEEELYNPSKTISSLLLMLHG